MTNSVCMQVEKLWVSKKKGLVSSDYLKHWEELIYEFWSIAVMAYASDCMVTDYNFPVSIRLAQCQVQILIPRPILAKL